MNRFLLALITIGLLAGCNIIVQPTPDPVPTLRVREASYSTNFSLQDGQPIICDNRMTQIVYRFRYEGRLESWTSYLRGQKLGKIVGEQTFSPGSVGVSPYETAGYEVTYTLEPNTAPYAVDPASEVSPQGIIVTPVPSPTYIGATKLHLILKGAGGNAQPYLSRDIPVYINCS